LGPSIKDSTVGLKVAAKYEEATSRVKAVMSWKKRSVQCNDDSWHAHANLGCWRISAEKGAFIVSGQNLLLVRNKKVKQFHGKGSK
jgi:hypothetical protein